ncbi:hypothetical protein [Saccharopolyspora cebuensis]|uniref:Uncharacterized protein n=1 Tax=Saccharopolyspora cebuensis TaxID=418759 RepID=A0ABV4CMX0_9PSEU
MAQTHTDPAPLCGRAEFLDLLRQLTQDEAPRVFSLCAEVGERYDGHVEFWGMAFDDHVDVISASGRLRGTFRSAEAALRRLSGGGRLHLVWVDGRR